MSDTSAAVRIGELPIGAGHPLVLIAGPCVMESRDHTLRLAETIHEIARETKTPLIFKASYDKANRSSASSFRGPGIDDGLAILADVKQSLGLPILSDVHAPAEASPAGTVLDCLQIPAFLCRQTDLLIAAAETGRPVNVKKGQFMSPEEMKNVVDKLTAAGAGDILLTERGTFFGYHRLVNDMTAIPKMQRYAPVVFDATHSCQFPGGAGTLSGGQPEYTPHLAFAAVAAGADALFLEVHDNPKKAKSDPATVLPIGLLKQLLKKAQAIHAAAHS